MMHDDVKGRPTLSRVIDAIHFNHVLNGRQM